ncbi:MAG: molybdenum cofactor cytidylyltransferase [Thermodesulfobacteriota bacterium]|nr:molybdenum cofactor cytidylyltransferase [Thermodesulfobacteriota bacterium]
MENISAVLLGAGRSKRMGTNKLSLPWGRRTIFDHCLNTLLRSKVKEVIVVLNDQMREKGGRLKCHKVKVVVNPGYKKGMSSSIKRGISALNPRSDGILIALGDQPFLKTRTINVLIDAFLKRKGGIIVPSFHGLKGHPVIFHRRYEKELSKLRGDVGGKTVVERHLKNVRLIPVKSEGVIKDIDTWEDYRKELRMKS